MINISRTAFTRRGCRPTSLRLNLFARRKPGQEVGKSGQHISELRNTFYSVNTPQIIGVGETRETAQVTSESKTNNSKNSAVVCGFVGSGARHRVWRFARILVSWAETDEDAALNPRYLHAVR